MQNVEAVLEALAERLRYHATGDPGSAMAIRDEAVMTVASAIDDVLRTAPPNAPKERFVQIVVSGGGRVLALDAAGDVWWISIAELVDFGAWARATSDRELTPDEGLGDLKKAREKRKKKSPSKRRRAS